MVIRNTAYIISRNEIPEEIFDTLYRAKQEHNIGICGDKDSWIIHAELAGLHLYKAFLLGSHFSDIVRAMSEDVKPLDAIILENPQSLSASTDTTEEDELYCKYIELYLSRRY